MAPSNINRAAKPYSRPAPRPRASPEGQWLHDKAPGVPRAVQANATSRPAGGITNTRILVSNLHYEVTPKDLTQIFGQIGTLVREPLIRYDRSGRSTGVAVVTFETPAEATRAKNQFDGILAKNQPMEITYDTAPPASAKGPRRGANTGSLLNRIEKPPLLDRLSRNDTKPRQNAATEGGVGPVRNKPRGGAAGPRAGKRVPAKPKTAEDLDKELDAYLQDDVIPNGQTEKPAAVAGEGDVEMA
ncbi:RNA-binding domain-containing protein [Trametes versicolor FP-101664 SS1]|uniref:RNA-binding domain-containing protein n=1 Tax=Trametes versicolor (strain FP-101664) TaxID=717944 RepID=UPI00046245E7|nr:RNA-binding domain-containing protein [Trametes versicolor FP-101664 SS1]EIW55221.1 RNA-binding domain-containing protein [Trametes versicolor FP-101664 SS1]